MSNTTPGPGKNTRAFGLALLGVAAALAAFTTWRAETVGASGGGALVGGPFALQAADGKTVTDKDFLGAPTLVYFGYTHCPDICPTDLAEMTAIFAKLPDKPIKGLFITVDPERDTPGIMADYVSSFDKRIVGLSGTPEQIAEAERTFRVYARKGEVKPDGSYSMDHTSIVYLMDSKGAFVEAFNLDRPADEAAKELSGYF